ncbi:MAG: hypothetical protein M9884_17500 [Rhodocyclaceae bacterium]|nr:hypothetical protein [Rhodocyclaceae bacterium]
MNNRPVDRNLATLIARYPRLFGAGPRHPGSWVEPGWAGIVDALFRRIDERLATEPTVRFETVQVKEKFGRLRVYFELETSDIDGSAQLALLREEIGRYVEEAGARSLRTCARCGSAGTASRNNGVVATLCERHRQEGGG